MNLKFFFFIFSTIICSSKSSYVFKKINNDVVNLKINESEKEVAISISSQDYLMLDGYWYDGETCIFSDQFEIYGLRIYEFIQKNIISMVYLDLFFNTLNERVFVFKTEKKMFYERKTSKNFECKFKLFKKEDIRWLMTDYARKVSLIDSSDEEAISQVFDDLLGKLHDLGITYGIRFNNNNGEMVTFVEYELGVYEKAKVFEREKTVSFFEAIKSFKEPVTACAKHTFVSAAIFGPYGCILAYLMRKYLIKR